MISPLNRDVFKEGNPCVTIIYDLVRADSASDWQEPASLLLEYTSGQEASFV